MITEHALTYQNSLSPDDLNYLVKKANRLGIMGRTISRVFVQDDDEGTHIYFDVEPLKEKSHG